MVKLPYRSESDVSMPKVVRSHANGKIPPQLLQTCGLRNLTMVEPAARACRAMVAAALADDVRLDATGAYRSYERQLQMFKERYTTKPLDGRRTKTWNGVRYWQKPDVAMAATPGTSKHGWGLAPDLAQRSGSGSIESLDSTTLTWLAEHGPTFGFWNSVKSEPWHWPYFPGDDVPDAVVQMERDGKIRIAPDVPVDPQLREDFYRQLPFDGVLSKGSRGSGVEAVQWALTRAGFATGIDGDFGPITEQSVREFEAAKQLPVDGLIDQATWVELGLLGERARPAEDVTRASFSTRSDAKQEPTPEHGAIAAAAAAYAAGFRDGDLAKITMIAGRESGWQSDRINPRTSDRGMWQINWSNLQRDSYAELRASLELDQDMDLLDLEKNAAVAFWMYEDANDFGEPWFPWRGSDTGFKNAGPGWDPKGSHLWRTEEFAAEAKAAAKVVRENGGRPEASTPAPSERTTSSGGAGASYTIVAADADGISALIARCLGIDDEPWALRRAVAEAVARHNDSTVDAAWQPGDTVRFPSEIEGVRSYVVAAGDGLIAIAKGLGLGRSAEAQQRVAAINAWQGEVPMPADTWYGGAA